jgi:GxxExxY protein
LSRESFFNRRGAEGAEATQRRGKSGKRREKREERREKKREEKKERWEMRVNDLTGAIIGAAIEVHRVLGPGLLESAYVECLCRELTLRGIRYRRQYPLPLEYKGIKLDKGYQLDLLVEDCCVVEVKAVDALHPVHVAQALTYMRLGGWRIGLLLNFNVELLKEGGIRRLALHLGEDAEVNPQ